MSYRIAKVFHIFRHESTLLVNWVENLGKVKKVHLVPIVPPLPFYTIEYNMNLLQVLKWKATVDSFSLKMDRQPDGGLLCTFLS